MSETRKWLLPWGMEDNNNPEDSDDPEPAPASSEANQQTAIDKTPQYTIESAEIVIPDEGIKEHQPYTVRGKVKPVDGVTIKSTSISVYIFQRYKDIEAVDGQSVKGKINPETNTFEVTINGYLNPDNFDDDTEKPAGTTFEHFAEIRGPVASNTKFRSPAIKLPMATISHTLKRGCYDKTWSDPKKGTPEYPESGDNYIPSDAVKKVQTLLIKLKFLTAGNDTGFYGSLTEAAVRNFQVISKGRKRSKLKDGRIFFIPANEVTFTGTDDGIYGSDTEKESAHWNSNEWIKPREDYKQGDIDENGVRNGHGERGADNYHEGNQILDFQKLLKDIGAYPHKLDGWMGSKMEAATLWLKECIEKCDFVDRNGKKVMLDLKDLIISHRPKHADEALKKAAEKANSEKVKVAPKENSDPAWIAIARKEIGTQEIEGIENNPRVIEYHSATDGKATTDEVPWCSAFANWVMKEAGISGTNSANAFSWKTWGKKVDKPCYGCIAICDFGHVGFIVGKRTYPPDREGLLMLGGNQGKTGKGRVSVSWMPKKDISTFRVPIDFIDMDFELKDIDGDFHEINRTTTR